MGYCCYTPMGCLQEGNVKVSNIRQKYKGFVNILKNAMKLPKNKENPVTLTLPWCL